MSTSLSPRRSVLAVACLLFSDVVLATVSNAKAGDITYNIVDYPADEVDWSNPSFTDSVSGTITTDGNFGPLTSSDFLGSNLSLSTPDGIFTGELTAYPGAIIGGNTIVATSSQLLLSFESSLLLAGVVTSPVDDSQDSFNLKYYRGDEGSSYSASINYPPSNGVAMPFVGFYVNPPTGVTGSIGQYDPWVIATASAVPEPATLTLLGSALLGLGMIYLRRRGAKA